MKSSRTTVVVLTRLAALASASMEASVEFVRLRLLRTMMRKSLTAVRTLLKKTTVLLGVTTPCRYRNVWVIAGRRSA
uniref:Avh451 n=1 Tax=Phytophthora sojae TaxID=67593 RepID=G1FTC0_PHYSO|nr:Avh451 [Phytophthora sojae]